MNKRIKARMALLGVTPVEMARLFGVTDRTWRSWMADTDAITVGRAKVIAARLGTTVAELIGEEV